MITLIFMTTKIIHELTRHLLMDTFPRNVTRGIYKSHGQSGSPIMMQEHRGMVVRVGKIRNLGEAGVATTTMQIGGVSGC